MLKFRRKGAQAADMPDPAHAPASQSYRYADTTPRAADLTVGDYANGVPHIRLGAMFGSLLRQFLWIIPLFLLGGVAAWMLTADFKRSYTGEGTLMVQLGDEYVYQPVAGTQGQSSLLQTPDTITLNEVAIIKNPQVMDRVIAQIADAPGGLSAFDPTAAAKMARYPEGSADYKSAYMELRRKMDRNYAVAARPKSSIIDLAFKHEDPQFAVSTLNALMEAYLSYRRTIFVEGAGEVVSERRSDTQAQLKANETRMARFLTSNRISDFESEQKGASKRTEDLRAALNTLRAEMVATERSLATVEDQLRQTPETINLYVDDRASNRIAQAELELKQLLAKYLPTSDPVRQKQLELQELRSLQSAANGQATGGRRVGPNPVFQDLMRNRNTLQARADSLREQDITVQRQLDSSDGKLRNMTTLMPAYNDLLRERETLEARLKTYLSKEQEALINQQRAESSSENVRIISTANYPIKGPNMRMLAFVGAWAAWGFTLFMLALFRVFLDPRLYAAPAAQHPQPRQTYAAGPAAPYDAEPYHSAAPQTVGSHNPAADAERPVSHIPQEYVPPAYETYAPAAQTYPAYQPTYEAAPQTYAHANDAYDGNSGMPHNPYLNPAGR